LVSGAASLPKRLSDSLRFGKHSEKSERSMPHKKLSRNSPCPCGSGKKYKRCYGKGVEEDIGLGSSRQQPQYPIGTVAMYGPDDKTTTKIAAGGDRA
jgi:SEC-C motif